MRGFSNKFADFPDYIIGITREIWEDRGIATLHEYYAPDIVVRSPESVVRGNQSVIAATMATLAEFPDRQLLGEDVIWSGTPEMGQDPLAYTRDLIAREGGAEHCVKPLTPTNDMAGPYKGRGNDNEWGQRHADLLIRIMGADMAAVGTEYDRAAQVCYPGGIEGNGMAPVDTFWMGLRAAFPSAKFEIHHQIGRDDPAMPPRSAIRWSLSGKHDGHGAFGPPTGAEVYVLGISHAEFGAVVPGQVKLRREWTLYNDIAVWKQILLQTGAL